MSGFGRERLRQIPPGRESKCLFLGLPSPDHRRPKGFQTLSLIDKVN